MDPLNESIYEIAKGVPGRCHSCAFQQSFDLPGGTHHWCRAFGVEMSPQERSSVRGCPGWKPLRPLDLRGERRMLPPQNEAEEKLFWCLKYHLSNYDMHLKTVIKLARPGLNQPLGWIDYLDEKYQGKISPGRLADILAELRALGYSSLCQMVEEGVGEEC